MLITHLVPPDKVPEIIGARIEMKEGSSSSWGFGSAFSGSSSINP